MNLALVTEMPLDMDILPWIWTIFSVFRISVEKKEEEEEVDLFGISEVSIGRVP